MKSTFHYLLEPLDGKWYDSKNEDGLILSVSKESAFHTNRLAKVISIPLDENLGIEEEDIVVVHHNVFRVFYDIKGKETRSSMHFKDNLYIVPASEIYAKSKNGETFESLGEYTFVSPIKQNDRELDRTGFHEKHWGVVEIPGFEEVNCGDTVIFTSDSEYEFKIEDKVMYRIKNKDICAKVTM